jgi:hypothetical protein
MRLWLVTMGAHTMLELKHVNRKKLVELVRQCIPHVRTLLNPQKDEIAQMILLMARLRTTWTLPERRVTIYNVGETQLAASGINQQSLWKLEEPTKKQDLRTVTEIFNDWAANMIFANHPQALGIMWEVPIEQQVQSEALEEEQRITVWKLHHWIVFKASWDAMLPATDQSITSNEDLCKNLKRMLTTQATLQAEILDSIHLEDNDAQTVDEQAAEEAAAPASAGGQVPAVESAGSPEEDEATSEATAPESAGAPEEPVAQAAVSELAGMFSSSGQPLTGTHRGSDPGAAAPAASPAHPDFSLLHETLTEEEQKNYQQGASSYNNVTGDAQCFMMQALPRKTIVKDKARGMARGSRDKDVFVDDDDDEHDVGEAELLKMVADLEAKMEPDDIFPELRKIIQAVDSKQEVKELLQLMSERKLNELRSALNATYQPTIRRSVETIMADALLLKSAPYKEALQTTTRLRSVAMNTASFLLTKNYVNATGFQKARLDEVVQDVQNIKVANMRQTMQNLRSENEELEVKSRGFLGRIFG